MHFFLFVFLLMVPVFSQAECDTEPYTPIAERYERGLLFTLSKCGYPTSYVFGTYHSDDPSLKPVTLPVRSIIDDIDTALFEIVIDKGTQKEVSEKLQLPKSHDGLKSLLSEELYDKAVKILTPVFQWDEETINRFKPWAIAVLSQFPASSADGVVVDEQLQRIAYSRRKQVLSLETVDEQFSVFENLSLEQQILFLQSSLDDFDLLQDIQHRLDTLYIAQDLNGIAALSDEAFERMQQDYPSLAHYLEHALIDARNTLMTERALPFLKEAPTLVAVGALHLPGGNGILRQLEEKGFRIEVVGPIDVKQ